MKTTYVLGAGASVDAGYPFAKSMGASLLSWMDQHTASGYDFRAAAASLRSNFANAEDIEDLLTQIDDLMAGAKESDLERRMFAARVANYDKPAFIEAIRGWFEEIRQGPAESYEAFAHHVVRPGDSIISFNYDVALDRQLKLAGVWSLGDGYGFPVEGFGTDSWVKLLKLHGSINWLAVLFGGVRRGLVVRGLEGAFGSRPVFADPELSFLGYGGKIDSRFPRGGAAAVSPLILPTRYKKFYFDTSLGPEWAELWNSLGMLQLKPSERVIEL